MTPGEEAEREERRREARARRISSVLSLVLSVAGFWWLLTYHPDWLAALFHRSLDGRPLPW